MKTTWEEYAAMVAIGAVVVGLISTGQGMRDDVSANQNDIKALTIDHNAVKNSFGDVKQDVAVMKQRIEDIADFIGVPKRGFKND